MVWKDTKQTGPKNYKRTGLTTQMLLQALTNKWMTPVQIYGHLDWRPAPEVYVRYSESRIMTPAQVALRIIVNKLGDMADSDKSKWANCRMYPYVDKRRTDNGLEYRINKHGKARLAALQDQTGRKHTTKSGTRRKSNRRVQGSVPGGSDDAAPGGDV